MAYGNPQKHVGQVQAFVQTHLHERICVAEIARELGLNASYLNTCFHAQTGESITAYIRRCKTERAKQLLCRMEYSLAQVCGMLGYFDQSHFTRTFKTETGMTPGEFRSRYG